MNFISILKNSNIDFMKRHKIVLLFSFIAIICSIIAISIRGLNFGIDFSGGILIEAKISQANVSQVRSALKSEYDVQIQNIDNDNFLIRVAKNKKKNFDQSSLILKIQNSLNNNFDNIDYRKIDYVGPQIGSELINKGILAFLLSLIFLMIYIWIRFDWQFGIGAIAALIHDAILVLGFYSISQIEFNLTSIAAILTVIGYSINDSVVIYDRIRENLRKLKKVKINSIINQSLNSTLTRTVLTSFTTLLSLLALILFGGSVLESFSVGAFVGVMIGVYSSIYISAPILLYFDPRNQKKS